MSATRSAESEAELRERLVAAPEDLATVVALAELLAAQSRDREAVSLFRRALALSHDDARAQAGLGLVLHSYDEHRDESIHLLQRAISSDRQSADVYRALAWSLNESGRRREATTVVRAWCAAHPDDPAAQHLLAAYAGGKPPARAADDFVRQTFDDGAANFDSLLRESLHYRAPEALLELLLAAMPRAAAGTLDVLDMGCGTGLCAPLLRPLSRRLVGVDLSAGMLERAAARTGYDELHCAELTAWLAAATARFDLLFAADTLLYFGDLSPILGFASAVMREGGWIAFSVEKLPQSGANNFELATSGRFRHSDVHLRRALSGAGFADIRLVETRLRFEAGVAVMGYAAVAQSNARRDH